MGWQRVLPVLISIAVIVAVALLRDSARPIAAIVATMPITVALSLWVVASGSSGGQAAVRQFTLDVMLNLGATGLFAVAIWLAARAGWRLVPMLLAGYTAWGLTVLLIAVVRRFVS